MMEEAERGAGRNATRAPAAEQLPLSRRRATSARTYTSQMPHYRLVATGRPPASGAPLASPSGSLKASGYPPPHLLRITAHAWRRRRTGPLYHHPDL